MNHTNDLGSRLNEHYGGMSKGQRLLAAYITDHYDRAVFLTAAKLGEEVGVSESTVVRFASMLGYKGYPQFQRALEEMVRGKLDAVHKMEAVYGGSSQSEILDNILRSDALRIKNTLEEIDAHAFESAVDTILQADTIYVAGLRSCAPLAEFLGFYLNMMFEHVKVLHTSSASELFEQMVHIGERDVIIWYQLSEVFDAHVKGTGICQQPECEGDHDHGQHSLSDESVFFLQSACKERYVFHTGFPCGAAQCDQRTFGCTLHEKTAGCCKNAGYPGADLG